MTDLDAGERTSNMERCSHCGVEFAATSSPLGACPACLLKLGMSDPAMRIPADDAVREHEATIAADASQPRRSRVRLPSPRTWAIVAAILAGAAALWMFLLRPSDRANNVLTDAVRFTLTLPDDAAMVDGQFAVSPDGTQVTVVARNVSGQQRLWLRRLRSLDWRELPRTDGATLPFWSPDSRWIGFFDSRSLKRVDVASDLSQTICDAPSARGGSWSIDDLIVFAGPSGLLRVPAPGGTPSALTRVDTSRGEIAHLWPQFFPDGRHFLFTSRKVKAPLTMYVGEVNGSESRAVADVRGPVTVAGDTLFFPRGTAIAAQRFDVGRRQLAGDAQSISGSDGAASSVRSAAGFSVASTVLVYQRNEPRRRELVWFDRSGRAIGTAGAPGDYEGFAISPDGRGIAVAQRDVDSNSSNIWQMDVASERINRLTFSRTHDAWPVWSPDGAQIAFSSERDNAVDVYTISASGGGKEQVLFRSSESKRLTDWSRDGRYVIYTAMSPKTGADVWAVEAGGDHKPQAIDISSANTSQGVLSPDGRWIAFVSNESGADEVYVRSFPAAESRWQISTGGGTRPRWRSDGHELYFLSPGRQVMAVDVRVESLLRYGTPQPLFDLRGADDYAVAPDGRFLVQLPVNGGRNGELHVVLNWASELKR